MRSDTLTRSPARRVANDSRSSGNPAGWRTALSALLGAPFRVHHYRDLHSRMLRDALCRMDSIDAYYHPEAEDGIEMELASDEFNVFSIYTTDLAWSRRLPRLQLRRRSNRIPRTCWRAASSTRRWVAPVSDFTAF